MEEWAIINGDSTVGAGLQFDGFNRLITTNVVDLGGSALTLDNLTTLERTVADLGGKPQYVVCAYRELQRISNLVLSSYYRLTQAGAGSMANIPAGVAVSKWTSPFGTVDIIGSRYVYAASGYTTNRVYLIDDKSFTSDGNAFCMVDLMPISSIDLALIATNYRTLVAEFTALMCTIEAFSGKLINVG